MRLSVLLFSLLCAVLACAAEVRPLLHFTPEKGWLNDPNGLFYDRKDDIWHIYFQSNPKNPFWEKELHWGHATSKDLTNWTQHESAINPSHRGEGILSGSVVVDRNNTSGFFNDSVHPEHRIVALYTRNPGLIETQEAAYSVDGGYTFTKYEKNPVLDVKSSQFRDPKVMWHEASNQWIMTVVEAQDYQIQIYGSDDLKNWNFHSNFSAGYPGFQFECPGLSEVPIAGTNETKWVLFLAINPGAPWGGSASQYFVGDFDGYEFKAIDSLTRFVDIGKDYYALQTFSNVEKKDGVIGISWASNWQYANKVPASNWRGMLAMARNFTLDYVSVNPQKKLLGLVESPIFEANVSKTSEKKNVKLQKGDSIEFETKSGVFEFELDFQTMKNITYPEQPNLDLYITSSNGKESIRFGFEADVGAFYFDRPTNVFQNPYYSNVVTANIQPTKKYEYNIYGVVDQNVIELFFMNGTTSSTNIFYFSDGKPSKVELKSNYNDLFKIQKFSLRDLSV